MKSLDMSVPTDIWLQRFIQIFYAIKLMFLAWPFQLYAFYYDQNYGKTLWLAEIFGDIVSQNTQFYLFGLTEFILLALILIYPKIRLFRIIEVFWGLIFFALLFKSKEIGNSLHSFLICSFPIALINKNNKDSQIKLAINLHLSIYVCAGFWKLFRLIESILNSRYQQFIDSLLLGHLSQKAIETGSKNVFIYWFSNLPTTIHTLTIFIIIFFQLFLIYPIIKGSYSYLLGTLIILFHLANQLLLDVNFIETQALTAVLFFIGIPLAGLDKSPQQIRVNDAL